MKSTYCTIIVISFGYAKGMYEVMLEFPASVDCDRLEEGIEDIESRESLPPDQEIAELFSELLDDEPTVKVKRLYNLRLKEFNECVYSLYDDDMDMFEDAQSSVQRSVCRNCGTEGPSVEPDCDSAHCPSCGQDACRSTARIIGVI